jgi:hypothetical protein
MLENCSQSPIRTVFMKNFIICLLFSCVTLPAIAQIPYSIDLVSTGKAYIFLEGSWKQGTECVEAKIKSDVSMKRDDIVLKAYFYGDGKDPVHTSPHPSPTVQPDGSTLGKPHEIVKGKRQEFCFGIPPSIAKGSGKWKRVVVVFGDKSKVDVKVYPKDDVANFNFPEKSQWKQ